MTNIDAITLAQATTPFPAIQESAICFFNNHDTDYAAHSQHGSQDYYIHKRMG